MEAYVRITHAMIVIVETAVLSNVKSICVLYQNVSKNIGMVTEAIVLIISVMYGDVKI